jgi:hypothetical protein
MTSLPKFRDMRAFRPFNAPAPAQSTPETLAAAILAAGKRRSEQPPDAPPPGSLAAQIIAAAKKARGEK